MNCKPGDLAVIVGGDPLENIGKVVLVLERYGLDEWRIDGAGRLIVLSLNTGQLVPESDCVEVYEYDHNMRPLRDSDGEDEMLRIAGKPEQLQESMHDWWKRMHA